MTKLQTIHRKNQKCDIKLLLFKAVVAQDRLASLIFVGYLPQDLITVSLVSKYLRQVVLKALLSQRQVLIKKLLIYNPFLQLIQHKNSFSQKVRLRFLQNYKKNGSRQIQKINFSFAFKCKPKLSQNSVYQLSYSYELKGKKYQKKKIKQSKKYFWKIQFDYQQKESAEKMFWLYRNPKKLQTDIQELEVFTMEQEGKDQTYVMDCKEISQKDIVKIEFPYFVNNKIANVQEFAFYPLKAKKQQQTFTSTIQKFFNKKKVSNCDVQNRYEWRKYEYFKNALDFELQDIIGCYKQLQLQQIYINTLEDHYKIQLKCKKKLKKSKFLNHFISISQKKQQVDVHLKHKGALSQENQEINLRIDDVLIIYVNIK